MGTSVLYRKGFGSRVIVVGFCLLVFLGMASTVGAAEGVVLAELRGGSGFVFAGIPAEAIDWELAGEPKGPHGGYQTTSSKCITCHSVHGAAGGTIPSTVAGASAGMTINRTATGCAFCHTIGAPATPNGTPAGQNPTTEHVWVYKATNGMTDKPAFEQEEASGHSIGVHIEGVPASTIEHAVNLSCSTCHLVHGSAVTAWKPTDLMDPASDPTSEVGYKFLRDNPSRSLRTDTDPLRDNLVPNTVEEAETLYQDLTGDSTLTFDAINQFTLSVWCANCHDRAFNPLRVPLDTTPPTFSDEATYTVSGDFLGTVHADEVNKLTLADGYKPEVSHTSPMQGLYRSLSGTMECYSCHRAGLSPDGSVDATVAGTLTDFTDALTGPDVVCTRCHYGYANYAADANRFIAPTATAPIADFPHSSADDIKLLGAFTIDSADSAGDYPITPETGWGSMDVAQQRTAICGRCHIPDTTATGLAPTTVAFVRSHVWSRHLMPAGWALNPQFGPDELYSPGAGAP